jgi:arylsulfatase A-like enzyme
MNTARGLQEAGLKDPRSHEARKDKYMRRRRALHVVIIAICMLGAVGAWHVLRGRDDKAINVVLISIDTLRADHLGCYGYDFETSPNIDRLATESTRFTKVFSQSSWTLPSHMSIMTSQYPSVHGVGPSQRALADTAITLAEVFSDRGYETAGFVSWVFVGKQWGFAQGFDRYIELWGPPKTSDDPAGGAFSAKQVTDYAVRWIKGKHSNAFFLFVHYFDPHMNYSPPPPFDTMFDASYSGPGSGEWSWIRSYIKWLDKNAKPIGERDLKHIVALYDGEIRCVDGQIQRLLDALDDSVGLDDCLVVVTSDHGEEFNDHGSMEGHGWTLYDEILHVPLIMRMPGGLPSGVVVDSSVALIDIAPTILDLLSIPAPREFQGRTFADMVHGPGSSGERRYLFGETYRFNRKRSIRGPRYKLIHTEDTGVGKGGVRWAERWELFDILRDPKEQEDLFDEHSSVAEILAGELEQFRLAQPDTAKHGKRVEIPEQDLQLLRSLGYVE